MGWDEMDDNRVDGWAIIDGWGIIEQIYIIFS